MKYRNEADAKLGDRVVGHVMEHGQLQAGTIVHLGEEPGKQGNCYVGAVMDDFNTGSKMYRASTTDLFLAEDAYVAAEGIAALNQSRDPEVRKVLIEFTRRFASPAPVAIQQDCHDKNKKFDKAALEELVRCSHALALQSRRQLEVVEQVLKDRDARPDYQNRVIDEKNDLDAKEAKLHAFLETDTFKEVA